MVFYLCITNDVSSDKYFMCILRNVLKKLCLYALCTC